MQPFVWKRLICLRRYQFLFRLLQGVLAITVFIKYKITYEYMIYILGTFIFFTTIKSDIIVDIRGNSENLLVLPIECKKMLQMKLSAYMISDFLYWIIFAMIYMFIKTPLHSYQLIKIVASMMHFICFLPGLYYTGLFILVYTWKVGKNSIITLWLEGIFLSIAYSAISKPVVMAAYILIAVAMRFLCIKIVDSLNPEKIIINSME